MVKYNLVDFSEDEVLNIHLKLIGLDITSKNRETLRQMGMELRLLHGKEAIRHLELQAYVMIAKNYCRLV